jgi:hypothetical protein
VTKEEDEMRTTTITTRKDKTTLTIETLEELYLEPAGVADQRIKLTRGVNNISVGAGVFRLMSKTGVSVTADSPDAQITTAVTGDKDGPIDPLDGKGQSAPR